MLGAGLACLAVQPKLRRHADLSVRTVHPTKLRHKKTDHQVGFFRTIQLKLQQLRRAP